MSLEELIDKCKQGDRRAQEMLYRKFSPALFGICLKYSRNQVEAEDNLHDSFMTIFDKIGQFKSKGSFEGWMKRITVNTALQKYRKEEHMAVVSENMGEEDTDGPIYGDISLQTLLRFVQELPHKYRTTFNLYVLDGFSHKEISSMLGTSTGTSKSNLARARIILREKIEKESTRSIVGMLILIMGGI